MKKRRALLLILLALLLIIGIPTSFFVREYRREQASRDLIAAIKTNDTARALAALRAGADANATDLDDRPPSMREALHRFWNRLIHPNTRPKRDYHLTALLLLLEEHQVYDRGNRDEDVWRKASDGRIDSTWRIARNDAHVDQEWAGYGGLYIAWTEDFAVVKALVDKGADVNVRDAFNNTPLLLAARWDYRDSLRLLIRHDADLHARDSEGYSALDWASFHGNTDGVQELILQGIDVNARDRKGNTLLDHNQMGHDDQRQFMAGWFYSVQEEPADKRLITQGQFDATMAQDRTNERQVEQLLRKAGAKTGAELDSQAVNLLKR